MRLLLTQISLAAIVALTVILSNTNLSAEALLTDDINYTHSQPASSIKSYDQHRVIRIKIHNEDQLKTLTENENPLHFDYFTHHKNIGGHIDVRIAPENFKKFQDLKLDYETLIENLQTVLDNERKENEEYQIKWEVTKRTKMFTTDQNEKHWFDGYHWYHEHKEWLEKQIQAYPAVASSFSVGKTHQGREQAGIKIGFGASNVVLLGLQHSREWISCAVVEYIIDQLLTGNDARLVGYLQRYTFHIIPIANPDGFVISQTTDRMHRKNAQLKDGCIGTDTNRNWNFHWNEGGASTNPCADDYMGPFAFSSPEARNIAEFLSALPNVVSFIDFHSYSQLWMTPYGYTGTPPDTYTDYLKPLADGAVAALFEVNDVEFTAGDIYHVVYPASGSSVDYAMSVGVGAPFAVELRDTGVHGFSLPENQIIPSGQETWEALASILDNLRP
ncbi:hypothetical protein EDD21DRAFT_330893 [Dissophora ornata]|nr:hypothetical protein EDD21DRAFT_330893 [Dissophora ornata]